MKKKVYDIEIKLPLFKCHVLVLWDYTGKEIQKWGNAHGCSITDKWVRDFEEWKENAEGVCMRLGEGNKDVLVWLKKKPEKMSEYGTLYHELSHATDHIIDDHLLEGTEVRAYIIEYLINECNKVLW